MALSHQLTSLVNGGLSWAGNLPWCSRSRLLVQKAFSRGTRDGFRMVQTLEYKTVCCHVRGRNIAGKDGYPPGAKMSMCCFALAHSCCDRTAVSGSISGSSGPVQSVLNHTRLSFQHHLRWSGNRPRETYVWSSRSDPDFFRLRPFWARCRYCF